MKRTLTAALALALTGFAGGPAPALAQHFDNRWQGDRNSGWDPANHFRPGGRYHERRMQRTDRIYRGHDGRFYCRRADGSTGRVVGAVSSGLLGNQVAGDSLSNLATSGGGRELNRALDSGRIRCR